MKSRKNMIINYCKLILITFLMINSSSCNDNELKKNEIKNKSRELDLKEREIELREKEFLEKEKKETSNKSSNDKIVLEKNNTVSIKETVDWINNTFKGNQPLVQYKSYSEIDQLNIGYDGKFTNYVTRYWKNSGQEKIIISGNFKDLNQSVSSQIVDDIVYFYIKCSNGNCINQIGEENVIIPEVAIGYISYKHDESLIKRIENAFNHLIKEFGGKKQVF